VCGNVLVLRIVCVWHCGGVAGCQYSTVVVGTWLCVFAIVVVLWVMCVCLVVVVWGVVLVQYM
jgi:hypothetical protein